MLSQFTAKPGDKPRTTPHVAAYLADLQAQHPEATVDAILDLSLSTRAFLKRPGAHNGRHVSRSELQRHRATIYGLKFLPRYEEWLSSDRTNEKVAAEFAINSSTVATHRSSYRAGLDKEETDTPGDTPVTEDASPAAPDSALPGSDTLLANVLIHDGAELPGVIGFRFTVGQEGDIAWWRDHDVPSGVYVGTFRRTSRVVSITRQ